MPRIIDLYKHEKCYIFYVKNDKIKIVTLNKEGYLTGDKFIELISKYDNEALLKDYLYDNKKIDNKDIELLVGINRGDDDWALFSMKGNLKEIDFFNWPIFGVPCILQPVNDQSRIEQYYEAMDRVAEINYLNRNENDSGIIDGKHLNYIFK